MTARFDRLGQTEVYDGGVNRPARRLTWTIRSPHEDWVVVEFVYSEWYRRTDDDAWLMVKYHYDYFDLSHDGRRAYHCHDLPPTSQVSHAHCERPIGAKSADHFRYIEVDLIEAHEDFERIYAADQGITCTDLRELHRERLSGW